MSGRAVARSLVEGRLTRSLDGSGIGSLVRVSLVRVRFRVRVRVRVRTSFELGSGFGFEFG